MNRICPGDLQDNRPSIGPGCSTELASPCSCPLPAAPPKRTKPSRKNWPQSCADVEGDKIAPEAEVSPLPDAVPRAGACRDEFRTAIEAALKKSLADYSLNAPEGKTLKLKAGLRECRVVDLVGPNGKTPLFQSGRRTCTMSCRWTG